MNTTFVALDWASYLCIGAIVGWAAGAIVGTRSSVVAAGCVGAAGAFVGGSVLRVAFSGFAGWWVSAAAAVVGAIGSLLVVALIAEKR